MTGGVLSLSQAHAAGRQGSGSTRVPVDEGRTAGQPITEAPVFLFLGKFLVWP